MGCLSGSDCALRACNTESCQNETCVYTPDADGGSCGAPDEICCGGICVNRAGDDGQCACTSACSGSDTCQNGVCCTVCASGCPFTNMNAALNAASVGATVRLCPGTYAEQRSFSKDVTLVGMGATPGATVITRTLGPIIEVLSGKVVTLRNLKVTGTGTTSSAAPAVRNSGDLTLDRVEVTGNSLDVGFDTPGGGISNSAVVTLIDSVVSQNSSNRGGGIVNTGTMTLTRSFVENNIANRGGGVLNAVGSGAGVYNQGGTIVISSGSSIAGNTSGGDPDNCVNVHPGTGCPA